jgi:hypothetical protein
MDTESPDDPGILLRIARTMLGTMYDEAPSLVTGRVPDGWPSSLVPAPPVIVLGGMQNGTALAAVFLYPATVDRPFEECRALLERNGWTPPLGAFGQGFDSTRTAMYCRESSLAMLWRPPADPADKSIVVSIRPCEGWPCHEDPRMPQNGTINIPRLATPPGVRSDGGGGSGGGGDHINSYIRVTTDLSPAELLPFYAGQLADAGWVTGHSSATSAHAIQWLDANDQDGRPWHGLLTVYMNGRGREVFIYMTKVPD